MCGLPCTYSWRFSLGELFAVVDLARQKWVPSQSTRYYYTAKQDDRNSPSTTILPLLCLTICFTPLKSSQSSPVEREARAPA